MALCSWEWVETAPFLKAFPNERFHRWPAELHSFIATHLSLGFQEELLERKCIKNIHMPLRFLRRNHAIFIFRSSGPGFLYMSGQVLFHFTIHSAKASYILLASLAIRNYSRVIAKKVIGVSKSFSSLWCGRAFSARVPLWRSVEVILSAMVRNGWSWLGKLESWKVLAASLQDS